MAEQKKVSMMCACGKCVNPDGTLKEKSVLITRKDRQDVINHTATKEVSDKVHAQWRGYTHRYRRTENGRKTQWEYDNKPENITRRRKLQPKATKERRKKDPAFAKRDRIRALTKYRIKKKPECEICGSKKELQFHHPDYDKPEAITLCRVCHLKEHGKRPYGDVYG